MALNKNQEIRRLWLDQIFVKRRIGYTQKELLDIINNKLYKNDKPEIKLRSLANDIEQMKQEASKYGVDLAYNPIAMRYEYDKEGFSLFGIPVGEKELHSLSQAVSILQQINGLNHSREIERIIQQLAEKIGVKPESFASVIQFDYAVNLKGIDFLDVLFMSIVQKQCLTINYEPFDEEPKIFTFHPYLLKEYNNRWYVIGYAEEFQKTIMLSLDRIVNVSEKLIPFYNDASFTSDLHFKDIIGVTIPDGMKPQKIVLRFDPKRGNYVKTKPLHPTQTIIEDLPNALTVCITVIPNKELISQILFFGMDVKVLQPESLVREVKHHYEKALQQY